MINDNFNLSASDLTIEYNSIAKSYDFINNLLSIGLIKYWRKEVSSYLTNRGPLRILDLACGSGEQILSFFRTKLEIITVNGIDISDRMVALAQKKVIKENLGNCVFIEKGDISSRMRFCENFFDAVTITFSLRDVNYKEHLFREAHRLLKGDCPFIILEIADSSSNRLKYFYNLYLKFIFTSVGGICSGSPGVYKSIWKRLSMLPDSEQIKNQLKLTGFQKVNVMPLLGGIAYLISGKKRVY